MGKSDNFDDFVNNSLLKNISRQNLKHEKSRELVSFLKQIIIRTYLNSNFFKLKNNSVQNSQCKFFQKIEKYTTYFTQKIFSTK